MTHVSSIFFTIFEISLRDQTYYFLTNLYRCVKAHNNQKKTLATSILLKHMLNKVLALTWYKARLISSKTSKQEMWLSSSGRTTLLAATISSLFNLKAFKLRLLELCREKTSELVPCKSGLFVYISDNYYANLSWKFFYLRFWPMYKSRAIFWTNF